MLVSTFSRKLFDYLYYLTIQRNHCFPGKHAPPLQIYVKSKINRKHIIRTKWEQMCFERQCEDRSPLYCFHWKEFLGKE